MVNKIKNVQKEIKEKPKTKTSKGITLEWTQKIRQNWTWFDEGGII